MSQGNYLKLMIGLTLAGTLFAGYLSGVKVFTSTCALNEECPYFLGLPACLYGFGMYLLMFVVSVLGFFRKVSVRFVMGALLAVSALGILFAGYFTMPEMVGLLTGAKDWYSLGLPTCAYGLIFYIVIFLATYRQMKKVG